MRNYWWLGISKYVLSYVDGCDVHMSEGEDISRNASREVNPIPNAPWVDISMDFIMGLPEVQRYDAILVICDHFTKQVHIIFTTKEMNLLCLVCLYHNNVWKLHGLPNMVVPNHGPQFASAFMKELNKILGIETELSEAYHPQTDGQTEQ